MTDGSSHSMSSYHTGDVYTVNISPVTDVDAFAQKIDFGKVTKVEERTVYVDYGMEAEMPSVTDPADPTAANESSDMPD